MASWKAVKDEAIEPGLITDGWLIVNEQGELVAIIAEGNEQGTANMLLVKAGPRLLAAAEKIVLQGKDYQARREADRELSEVVALAKGLA
jgi:hypothetical protein